jgi:hypothetical protein
MSPACTVLSEESSIQGYWAEVEANQASTDAAPDPPTMIVL